MVRSSGPVAVELPLFLIACKTISGEKRGVELSRRHSLRSFRLTSEGNCLAKAVSRMRVRVLEEKVIG